MGILKSVSRSATVAWCPTHEHASLLCAGTVAGAMDANFDASASLEIFGQDFTATDEEMSLLGTVSTNDRFNRIAWGCHGIGTAETSPYGIIAGGMVDGTINIWNPAAILKKVEQDPLIATMQRHTGPVRGLEFNPSVSNLLASGATNSEVWIIDVSNPSSPQLYAPGTNSNQQPADISYVAWNRKVQHILASTSHNGMSVVWDLKLKRPVISFKDPNGQMARNSVIAWNPEVATQLVVASEDDRSPIIQMWDLRNAFAPIKELHGHTKGVLSASWCPIDSGLLLTSGKDNRTLCWNPDTAEILSELPQSQNWAHDVQWSPRIPAILSVASFDGKVAVHSLQDSSAHSAAPSYQIGEFGVSNQGPAESKTLKQAPKWLQRPCGACFGFGGQLVTFKNDNTRSVKMHSVTSNPQLANDATRLQSTLQSGSLGSLTEMCEAQVKESTSEKDTQVWGLMKVLCTEEPRKELLALLDLGDLPSPESSPLPTASPEDEAAAQMALLQLPTAGSAETDSFLKKALLHGSFEAAVGYCVQAGRMADALILAASGGPELWTATRDAYLCKQSAPFMKVVSCIVHHQLDQLVADSELNQWKETLGLLNTYSTEEELSGLCNALGERLETEKMDVLSATLCYMCGGNVEKCTDIWLGEVGTEASTAETQSLIEKVMIFRGITKSSWSNAALQHKFGQYADMLASQGCMLAAMEYLGLVEDNDGANTSKGQHVAAILCDRIYHSNNGGIFRSLACPAFPFEQTPVGMGPAQQPVPAEGYTGQPANGYAGQQLGSQQYTDYTQTPSQPATGYYQAQQPNQDMYQEQQPNTGYYQPQPVANAYQPQQETATYEQQPATNYYQPQPADQGNTGFYQPQPAANYYQPQQTDAYSQPEAAPTPPTAPVEIAAAMPVEPPKPTVTTAEASEVPDDYKPIAATLQQFVDHMLNLNLPPGDKRKMEDVKKRLSGLFAKMVNGELSAKVLTNLNQMTQALQAGDYSSALQMHVAITTSDWADNGPWLMGLKRLIETASKLQRQ